MSFLVHYLFESSSFIELNMLTSTLKDCVTAGAGRSRLPSLI